MADSGNTLNSLLQLEREENGSPLVGNSSLIQRNEELEVKIENLLVSQKKGDESQSTRFITIRSDLIQIAEKQHNEANKEPVKQQNILQWEPRRRREQCNEPVE